MSSTAHAFLAPSSAHRWIRCPGSALMQSKYPEQGDKQSAVEGTAAHWVMEQMFLVGMVARGAVAANSIVVTQEMLDGADIIVKDVIDTLGPSWPSMIRVEQPVQIPRVHKENRGTPDVYAWFLPTRLYLWDYKFGHDQVEVFENWQLIDYVAGLLTAQNTERAALGLDAVSETEIEVIMRICQPRAYHPGGTIREWRCKASDLRDYVFRLSMAADEACGDNPMCKPDPVACEHCSARHVCDALQTATYRGMEVAKRAQANEMSPAAVGLELRYLTEIEGLIKARKTGLEQQVDSLLRARNLVPHWRLAPGETREAWVKPAAEVVALGQMLGVDLAKPLEAITPTQAKAKGLDATIVSRYSQRPPGALKLTFDDGTEARRVFSS